MSAPALPVLAVSAATAQTVWLASLGLFSVVLLVVVLLLHTVLRTAGRIEASVADIWTTGKKIAGNTVQVAMLRDVNRAAVAIVGSAGELRARLDRIHEHARGCSGCPRCILRRAPRRGMP